MKSGQVYDVRFVVEAQPDDEPLAGDTWESYAKGIDRYISFFEDQIVQVKYFLNTGKTLPTLLDALVGRSPPPPSRERAERWLKDMEESKFIRGERTVLVARPVGN